MAILIIFASSVLFVMSLIVFKAIESRFGKRNFILELVRKLDAKSEKFIATLKFRTWQAIQSVRYLFVVKIKATFFDYLQAMQYKIAREYDLQQNTLMGRKQIVGSGSASFYLKKISEEKSFGSKGKIE